MSAQAHLVIVATSSGHLLAQDIAASGQYRSLVDGPNGVPTALLGFNGAPVLNHLLQAVQECPRLLPLHDKVFILCNDNNYNEIIAWASNPQLSSGGFPPDNIISIGAPDSLGLAADLATFLQAVPAPGSLVVAEADALMAPGFSLARLLEHSAIRGKDTVAYAALPRGSALGEECLLTLDDPTTSAPRVQAVDAAPPASSTSDGAAYGLAPLAVLRPSTVAQVAAAAAAAGGPTAGPFGQQLGHFLAHLIDAGAAVYGVPVDCYFRIGRLPGLQLASHFFSYYLKELTGVKGEAAKALEAAKRLAALNEARTRAGGSLAGAVRLLQEEGTMKPAGASGVPASVREMYDTWWAGWLRGERQMEGERRGASSSPLYGTPTVGGPMPIRFADATTRRHTVRAQHPIYLTSNNDYGLKPPAQMDMPSTYASSSQAFTNTFPAGHGKSSALLTSVTRSKVHTLLDDF